MGGDFDDELIYDLVQWIYIWDVAIDDQQDSYNRAAGNMGVGKEQTEEKLHIYGNLRVDPQGDEAAPDDDLGKIQTEVICDETKNDCFAPEHFGAEEASDERLKCTDSDFPIMRGIKLSANADPKARQLTSNGDGCASAVGTGNTGCAGIFDFMTGLTLDATTGNLGRDCANILN